MATDPTTTGGCLCGKIRYRMTGPVLMCVACHCKNCQRQAGSALSVVIGLDEDAIEITGTVKTYRDKGENRRGCVAPVLRRLRLACVHYCGCGAGGEIHQSGHAR